MKQFSPKFCAENRMFVHSVDDSYITIARCPSSINERIPRMAEMASLAFPEKRLKFVDMSESELMRAIGNLETELVKNKDSSSKNFPPEAKVDIRTIENNSPVITVLNSILLEGKEKNASDIHLETGNETSRLRFRTQGNLDRGRNIDSVRAQALALRIKLLSNLNTLENRRPQDGRFTVILDGKEADIRVSCVPCSQGESIVLRYFDVSASLISLEDLSFNDETKAFLRKTASLRHGLVLLTGPTGSGKTSTLAALLRECGPDTKKIISIEDPVEYRIPGVIQIQTHDAIGLTFAGLLKRVLRQDPDVLMVGEIRDGETASLAVRAALTGHLVFATLHTAQPEEAAARLSDLGVPPYLIKAVLVAVLGQKLDQVTLEDGSKKRVPVTRIHYPDRGAA